MAVAQKAAETEVSLELWLDLLPMGACVARRDLSIIHWNQTLSDWTGLSRLTAIGANLGVLAPNLLTPKYHVRLMEVFDSGTPAVFSSAIHKSFLPAPSRHGADEELMVQQTSVRLLTDGSGLALITIQDVTSEYHQLRALRQERTQLARLHEELARQNAKLAELASVDELTGVKNRRRFKEDMDIYFSLSARQGTPLSLVLLDVDHFKQFNDTFGHPAGDLVLRAVACLLRDSTRDHDVAARYGGEEFAVLLPSTSADDAMVVAERLRDRIERATWPLRSVTASLGVATTGGDIKSSSVLIEAADQALYCSKRSGRNRVTHDRSG